MARAMIAIRAALLTAALAATTALTAPQATAAPAADGPEPVTIAGVAINAKADKETRRIASSETTALQMTANLCGSRYTLYNAERLPTAEDRKGTLFTYTNGGAGPRDWICSVFDNNTGSTKWMKLKICENKVDNPRCDVDEGNFSQHAGPVRMNNCPTRTALMKYSASSPRYLINAARGICN
ncbi:hypothetical protein ACQUSR_27035 [Streptomyces sp. P1-3]|uniref:hypothetical protein n=1 Tax=Streptomyces sp. P1-3 TaxID=3421658 RepID=UPI003D36C76D